MRKQPNKVYYTPPAATTKVTLRYQKTMTEMSDKEAESYLQDVRSRLVAKMQREQRYLDRRAARGTDTPRRSATRYRGQNEPVKSIR